MVFLLAVIVVRTKECDKRRSKVVNKGRVLIMELKGDARHMSSVIKSR